MRVKLRCTLAGPDVKGAVPGTVVDLPEWWARSLIANDQADPVDHEPIEAERAVAEAPEMATAPPARRRRKGGER